MEGVCTDRTSGMKLAGHPHAPPIKCPSPDTRLASGAGNGMA